MTALIAAVGGLLAGLVALGIIGGNGPPPIPTSVFTLNASANPPVGGFVLGGGNYSLGSEVTLARDPNQGYVFTGWTGACSGTGPCVGTMSRHKNVSSPWQPPLNHTMAAP